MNTIRTQSPNIFTNDQDQAPTGSGNVCPMKNSYTKTILYSNILLTSKLNEI